MAERLKTALKRLMTSAQCTPEQDGKARRGCIFIQPCYNQKRAGE